MDIYEKTMEFVDNSFGNKQKLHFERTVHWLIKFLPNHTEAHQVAAYAHDIERAFRNESIKAPDDYLDQTFLRQHQEGGAEIMEKFLKKQDQSQEFIITVKHLISRHEEGGDEEQNALMDADSVSFFETNAETFVTQKAPVEGFEKVKAKLDWMFNRIQSDAAMETARENYNYWIKELENYK